MARWLVFDASATQVGALQLPAAVSVLHATRRSLLSSGLSTEGEPIVVRYDITTPAR